jgi:hypothetical protein
LVLPAIERLEQKSARELAQRKMHELYPLQLDRELREQTGPSLRPLVGAAEKSASLLERSEPPPELIPEWNVVPEEPSPELMPQWNVASEGEVGEADAAGHKVHGGTHTAAEQRAETRKRQAASAAQKRSGWLKKRSPVRLGLPRRRQKTKLEWWQRKLGSLQKRRQRRIVWPKRSRMQRCRR